MAMDKVLALDLVLRAEKLQKLRQTLPALSPFSVSPLFLLQSRNEEHSTSSVLALSSVYSPVPCIMIITRQKNQFKLRMAACPHCN